MKQQVESQIKVRDFSRTAVTIAPAEYASWHEARSDLMAEAKTALKARLETELAAAADDAALEALRAKFSQQERDLEHTIDHTTHTFACQLDVDYNFLRCAFEPAALPLHHTHHVSSLTWQQVRCCRVRSGLSIKKKSLESY